jgi:hypothetical protein
MNCPVVNRLINFLIDYQILNLRLQKNDETNQSFD